jgi:2,3-diketo-5-methylthiopentyl-1-phosphate enolase
LFLPCIGFDAQKGAKLFYESGLGGVDLIKDDEVLGNTTISNVVDRVKAYNKAGDMVEKETGKKPVYIANITDTVKNMRIHAKNIIEEGAQSAMINFIATGADAFYEITQEFGDKLCFLAHYAGLGIMNSPKQGIADDVMIGTIARLAGADSVMTMYTHSDDTEGRFECIKTVQKQQLDMGNIKPVMTSWGGGITPASIHEILENFSNDIIIGVGGAIQGHPMGTVNGSKAVMDTLYGAIEGKKLEEICQSNEAVKMAVELWG